MSVRKLSITLPEETAAGLREIARREGRSLSAVLAEAAVALLRRKAAQEALRAFEAEEGALTEAELARARAILAAGDAALLAPDKKAS